MECSEGLSPKHTSRGKSATTPVRCTKLSSVRGHNNSASGIKREPLIHERKKLKPVLTILSSSILSASGISCREPTDEENFSNTGMAYEIQGSVLGRIPAVVLAFRY